MSSYENLLQRVKLVRKRWRLQMAVKGYSLFLASTIALLVLGVWGADLFGFRSAAVWLMRIVTGGAVLFVGWRFIWVPFRRRVTDVQIAQFIEERYPQLEDRLVSAVEFGAKRDVSGILDLLIRDALEKTRRIDFSIFVDRRRLMYFGTLAVGSFLALFALLNWGPSFFPYGFNRIYVPWTEAAFGASMSIQVVPGNIEIATGSDQQIKAQLVGFDSPDVKLYQELGTATSWTSSSMEPEPAGSGFLYLLIDVRSSLRYYVEAKGVRSPVYTVNVVDVPRVERIRITYNFPAYTGMPPQTVENDGDISALKGTKVDLLVHLSRPADSARLLFDDQSSMDLRAEGKQDFAGSLTLKRSGSYVVQLASSGGERRSGSTEYEIEAIDDAPPKVTITKPFRDVRATSVEEVFSEVKAEDDIGVGKVELHYSVNGGPEKTLNLRKGEPGETAVTASHTFFLEELGLQPGDVVSYYGKASDNNNVTGPGTSSSDIYFIEIRPFEQKYVQNQQGGGPGGGAGGNPQEALSRQQKEIVAATFKLIRDKEKMDPKEYSDGLKALSLVQTRLQLQTQGVVDRMQRRGAAEVDAQFGKLTEYLKAAMRDMEKAAVLLGAQRPPEALPEEEKALQQLMRAESLFHEIQISFASAGGGGGSQTNAEDLADLFELELNKLKNQYETVQRGEQQVRDQKLDEALQRLKELAQRQQQLNERSRLMAGKGGSSASSSGGGQGQQQILDEVEKLQRQLQRLSRERSSPELNQATSQLQKAIDEMKKALQGSQRGNNGQSTAQGIRALQQLDEAMRQLARGQDAGLSRSVDQAAAEAKRLLEEQKKIQEGVDRLAQQKQQQAGSPEYKDRTQDLVGRKTALAGSLKGLGEKIESMSREARKTQKETSSRLNDAVGTIRDKKLPERIMSNNQLLQNGYLDFAKSREEFIRGGLEDLSRQLEAARNSIGQTKEGKLEDAANKARQLAEGLESTRQRLHEMQRLSGRQDGSKADTAQQRGQQGQQSQSPSSQAQAGQRAGSQGVQGESRQGERGMSPQTGRNGMPGTDARDQSGNLSGPPGLGPHRDESDRQLGRELQQRLLDAQDLRRLLDRNSTDSQHLDRVIEDLRRMGQFSRYDDPDLLARLKGSIDRLHQLELDLNRELSRLTQKEKYFYAEDSEAPSSYRKLVEDYYKALAKSKSQ